MELRQTPFTVGNDRYYHKEVAIDSNFSLSVKERRLLEGLALIMEAYNFSAGVIAKAVKDCCAEVLESMMNEDNFWGDVYSREALEGRINYYREVISELQILIACL